MACGAAQAVRGWHRAVRGQGALVAGGGWCRCGAAGTQRSEGTAEPCSVPGQHPANRAGMAFTARTIPPRCSGAGSGDTWQLPPVTAAVTSRACDSTARSP